MGESVKKNMEENVKEKYLKHLQKNDLKWFDLRPINYEIACGLSIIINNLHHLKYFTEKWKKSHPNDNIFITLGCLEKICENGNLNMFVFVDHFSYQVCHFKSNDLIKISTNKQLSKYIEKRFGLDFEMEDDLCKGPYGSYEDDLFLTDLDEKRNKYVKAVEENNITWLNSEKLIKYPTILRFSVSLGRLKVLEFFVNKWQKEGGDKKKIVIGAECLEVICENGDIEMYKYVINFPQFGNNSLSYSHLLIKCEMNRREELFKHINEEMKEGKKLPLYDREVRYERKFLKDFLYIGADTSRENLLGQIDN